MIEALTGDKPWKLFKGWISPRKAEMWKSSLSQKVSWEQPIVKVYGRRYQVPRLSAFLADQGIQYRYSGVTHIGKGWPIWLMPLLNDLNTFSGFDCNGCLLNLYRNGEDRMGWHSDNEPEIDSNYGIASLSFGASRDICFKRIEDKSKEVVQLSDGDLLLMHPSCQREWQHSIPPRRKINSMRINLTFRKFK